MDYPACLKNLEAFMENREPTQIRFMYYQAKNLSAPKVKTVFGLWRLAGRKLYVCPGLSSNYCYVYEEKGLKALVRYKDDVRPLAPQNARPYSHLTQVAREVEVVHKQDDADDDAHIGDHIDFSMWRQRSGKILINTHVTSYTDWDQPWAHRNDDRRCNFYLDAAPLKSPLEFGQFRCDERLAKDIIVAGRPVSEKYSDDEASVVFHLLRAVTGETAQHGGTKHKVRTGSRGGRYILIAGRKKYLRTRQAKGGAPPPPTGYKGITFLSDAFATFVGETVVWAVDDATRGELHSAQIIYDEMNELHPNGSKNVVFVYDFGEAMELRNVFFVDAVTLFTACYAQKSVTENIPITPHERTCLETVLERVNAKMATVA